MLNKPLISIIVPVYNSQEYLEECLNSLRLQTYSNIEIICVNENSTDNSAEILEKYAKLDNRIVVINQNNLDDGEAKNTGIINAKGDYISFVNSEDRVSLSLYQKFINLTQKPDIYIFNACEYNKDTKNVFPKLFFSMKEWKNHKDENTIHTIKDNINPFHGNMLAVNKIFKTSFLKKIAEKNTDRKLFPAGLIFEELYFFFFTMLNASSIIVNPDPLYYQRKTPDDTRDISSKVFDIFKVMDKIESLLQEAKSCELYRYSLFQYKYHQYAHLFLKAEEGLREAFYEEMKKRLKLYKNLDSKICGRLMFFGVYKNIMRLNYEEFYKKYLGKI